MDTSCARGKLIAEGKTKKVYQAAINPNVVVLVSKDTLTAGDGARRDVLLGKARLANQTACNIFRFLKKRGFPVAFIERDGSYSFLAQKCRMLPYEVVVRREAHGSYLKRYPDCKKGERFPQLLTEFFLKTRDKTWHERALQCDDPFIELASDGRDEILLFHPAKPFHRIDPFLRLPYTEVFANPEDRKLFRPMRRIAADVFLALEAAWVRKNKKLVDFKLEFGISSNGNLLLADVIDNDSWRLLDHGVHIDKQLYRDNATLEEVAKNYRRVAEMTNTLS